MRLLLVEDDARIARFVAKGLREQAYAVDVTANGDDALYEAAINPYDLIILDVMIPGRNGFEVCRELRKAGQRVPILMLTARDAVEDRISGLDHGADDYLTKPFEFRELLARLRALLRRSGELRPAQITVADLVLDTGGQSVARAGKNIPVTTKEYALLEFLARNSVRVRLTLWYTGLLALFLVLLSLITYFIFWRSTLQRTDSNLAELSEAFLSTVQAEMLDNHGPDAPKVAAQVAIVEHRFRDHVFAVFDPKGDVMISSQDLPNESSPAGLLASASFRKLVDDSVRAERLFENVKGGRNGYRGLVRKFPLKRQTYTLVILQSLHPQEEMLDEVRTTFAWVIPISVALASVGGYFLARKSLAPVVSMSTQAGRIGAENLHERLPVLNVKDELGHLAASFNQLLERVDQSFERQRRFMSDASHELRTPAAILRGEAEVAL